MEPVTALAQVVRTLLKTGARQATKYLSERETVRATRSYKPDRRHRSETLVVTMGSPNYAEREFLKKRKRAGELVPATWVQLKGWPKKKARA